ncbi:MAG: class A beta-lactamase [Sphingopyxis sp.]|nr:class A beta-lactamase [Sphingopyxis sp.]
MMRTLAALPLLALAACASSPAATPPGDALAKRIAAIETKSGGRLGVAVTDTTGRLLFGHRADERFAMCSTFKLLLAGHVLRGATNGGKSLRTPLRFTKADLLPHSPFTESQLAIGDVRLGFAAEHIVKVSDNAAANLILKATGGPATFTQRMREMGDAVTRLDRLETELNENAPGDPRDTTSPMAMARSSAKLIYGDYLDPSYRKALREWMVESKTGLARIRAGLPPIWLSGDKTGTCGTAYNDVAFVEAPEGGKYMIAVYLDRPAVKDEAANAAIADVARAIVADLPD